MNRNKIIVRIKLYIVSTLYSVTTIAWSELVSLYIHWIKKHSCSLFVVTLAYVDQFHYCILRWTAEKLLYYPLPSIPSPPPFPALEVGPSNPATERCKLPQRDLGQSPSRNRICKVLANAIWWQQIWRFSLNSKLTYCFGDERPASA